MNNERDFSIDFLKAIGLLLIMLAHVTTNQIILQIRNFDVPFLIIISGLLTFLITAIFEYTKMDILY